MKTTPISETQISAAEHPLGRRLPQPLHPLIEMAMNLRWSWDPSSQKLFESIDPGRWSADRNPLALLHSMSDESALRLSTDDQFLQEVSLVRLQLNDYMTSGAWFQSRRKSPLESVAYFSPEFGVCEALPQYSGGLGILAGDHLKASSDLAIPLVGVGLFYREGYFRQAVQEDGWQQERYLVTEPEILPLSEVKDVRLRLNVAQKSVSIRLWRAQVGRVPLYLLDTDVEENEPEDRQITDRLYGGDQEHRLRQEIVLGMGGVMALEALGYSAQVFHMNEGHAGFLGLERIRRFMADRNLSFHQAAEAVRPSTAFTTHTSVPVGIDIFSRGLMEKYFGQWAHEAGVDFEELMRLGMEPEADSLSPFNMAVMCLRLAGHSNGVSRLHGRVSRAIFRDLWPHLPEEQTPISSITNGVHAASWLSDGLARIMDGQKTLIRGIGEDEWDRIRLAPDDVLWDLKRQTRCNLVAMVRGKLNPESNLEQDLLDPDVLTIGFARRFAQYKRSTLLFSQPDRLRALLLDEQRPVQLLLAGKAHPADEPGKQMIREIVSFSQDPRVRHRVAFIPDYDIAVARALYHGADVWLNNPRRPLEACGTSGMKASLNGALNLSISDGWWDEMHDVDIGWTIQAADENDPPEARDKTEADTLFQILEQQIVPLFYERPNGLPHAWMAKVKRSVAVLCPKLEASRMVKDYVQRVYEPLAAGDILWK